MKKIISLILLTGLFLSSVPLTHASTLPADDDIKTILDVMEIMTFDAKGSFNENQYVTRAALAKILVNASQYKGVASSSSRISPFSDVYHTHWGAPYISVASKNKFMTGYSNGSFMPDAYIKYEDALCAMLKLLGYTNADYTGAYPHGQISKAIDIGLCDEVNATVGNPVIRSEMAKLVYNLLNTPAKGEDAFYVTRLGYKPSSELLTVGDVLDDNMTGPVTVKPGTINTLNLSSPRVYRNGRGASLSDIENFDIIYYNTRSNVVRAYSQKVSGTLSAISPNKESPTSVTVSGVTYPLRYYAAQRAFGLDGLEVGETVTMLLDKNGDVCDAYESGALYESALGVVTDVSSKSITAYDGTKTSNYFATVLMLDGSTVDIMQSNDSRALVGKAVSVDMKNGSIKSVSSGSGSSVGYINESSLTWGNRPIDKNIKIIEIDDNGNMASLTLNRLDGVKLNSSNVLLSSTNSSGAIDGLILKNVTGDMHKYGLITKVDRTSVTDSQGNSSPSRFTYHYNLDGETGKVSFSGSLTDLTEGPCVFIYDGGELSEARNLARATNVTQLNPSYATVGGNIKHRISPDVQVYKIVDDTKIRTTLDEAVSHGGEIWIYYDTIQSSGGMIRVIYLR